MILPALAARHDIDVYVDREVWDAGAGAAERQADGYRSVAMLGGRMRAAYDFLPRHARQPYDLVVYQLGNAACHDYMWPYLVRHPGLVVLHDRQVHHARARALLQQGRTADYRAELQSADPTTPPGVGDWVIAGVGNMAAYLWPLTGHVIRASRAVAVHYPRVAAELRDLHPGAHVFTVRHGAPDLSEAQERSGAAVVFAAFGLVTPEKRIPQILRALAAIRTVAPHVRLKLVGDTTSHYDVRADAEQLGVADLVEITGFVTDEAFDRHIRESDVCLCLRWPGNREASGPWLRALAVGKPTVVNDLVHLVDVPGLDPRTWQVTVAPRDAAAALSPPDRDEAVTVSIDILDEDHSLALAMRRLALDRELRASLGRAARARWTADHTLAIMAADYEAALAGAAAVPVPNPTSRALPRHLLADGADLASQLAAEVGVTIDLLDGAKP
jgi:glycosyltransferase involved in cell wall biosynthesis